MSTFGSFAQLKVTDPIYSPIPSHDGAIRVLELMPGCFANNITIKLHPVYLRGGHSLSYEALSYVWGVGASTGEAWIGGESNLRVPITANLESALRHLRKCHEPRILWIDALCINQMDSQERSAQVQLMGEIYTFADNVIVWLGPEEDNAEFKHGLTLIRSDDTLSYSSQRNEAVHLAPTMYRILKRPWFERTWVVQELALSRQDPVILIGHRAFSWKSFLQHAGFILNYLDKITGFKASDYKDRFERASSFNAIRIAKWEPSRQGTAFFAYQLRRTLYLSATDPRDKVFGLLGISEFGSKRLLPDYAKSVLEVYTEATTFMLLNRYVSMYFESPLRPLQDHHTQLSHPFDWPSWVPNFTYATKTKRDGRTFNPARQSYQLLLEAPMDNLPLMLNVLPEERVDMLAQNLPYNLTAAEVSADNTRLSTYGLFAGTIIATSEDALQHLEWAEPPWLSLNSVYDIYHDIVAPNGVSSADYLCVLLPQEHRHSWRTRPGAQQHEFAVFDSFLNADRNRIHEYGALFDRKDDVAPGPFGRDVDDTMQELAEAISSRAKERIVFVTDKGHVGLSYHEDLKTGIRSGDILVGLFGVNFPFILRRNESEVKDTTHLMINVASVANHQWGHEFLGNIFTASGYPDVKAFDPDITWKDFEMFGMKQYVIV